MEARRPSTGRRLRNGALVVTVALAAAAVPVIASASPGWITPVATLSPSTTMSTLGTPLVAANSRGDTVVVAPASSSGLGPFTESERPAGGSFTPLSQPVLDPGSGDVNTGSAQSATLGLDDSGTIYLFFISGCCNNSTNQINVATKAIGASSWTVTVVQAKGIVGGFAPNPPVSGAVAPSGAAAIVWLQDNTGSFTSSVFDYATKAAGSSTWSAPATTGVTGGGTQVHSAVDSSGDVAAIFTFSGNNNLKGATKAAAGSWTTANNISSAAGSGIATSQSLAIDSHGQATAVWTMGDNTNANPIVQFSTKTLSASSWPTAAARGGANDLSTSGAGVPALAVAPDGTTLVGYTLGSSVFAMSRPSSGGAFGGGSLANSLTSPNGAQAAVGSNDNETVLWNGMSGATPTVAGAFRTAGGSFSATPVVPGSSNAGVAAVADGAGDVSTVWQNQPSAGNFQFQATGLVTAPPTISNVSFPSSATLGVPFSYSATVAPDQWTTAIGLWSFGDGTTGPVSGMHTYSTAGAFNALLTAADPFGNMATKSVSVNVPAPSGGQTAGTGGTGGTGTTPTASIAKITGLPASVKISRKTGKGSATAACGAAANDQCIVSGTIKFAGAVASRTKTTKIGTFAGRIAGGKRGKLTFKLTKKGLKLLKRKHTLKVTASGKSRNSAGQSVTISKKMRLKLKK